MIRAADCFKKYGEASKANSANYCTTWTVPLDIREAFASGKKGFPSKIYCNKDAVKPLETALRNVMEAGLTSEFKTFDGCFNIRAQRGYATMSLHSWGVAIDINASEMKLGSMNRFSEPFIKCWIRAGWDYGGNFKGRKDPMHFELSNI